MKLCKLADLPLGAARGFTVGNASVLAVHPTLGKPLVYLNRCPHLGVPLQWEKDQFLDKDNKFIRCATHGALFEQESGLCVLGPCRDDHLWCISSFVEHNVLHIDESELPNHPLP